MTDDKTRQERIKKLILALNFEGSLGKWENDWNILAPNKLSNKPCNVTLKNDPIPFNFREYVDNIPARTKWVAGQVPEFVDLISQIRNGPRDRPEVTTKNFVMQEMEALSRNAKRTRAAKLGMGTLSLQHDGVVIGITGRLNERETQRELREATEEILGYTKPVETKPMAMPTKLPKAKPDYKWTRETRTETARHKIAIILDINKSLAEITQHLNLEVGDKEDQRNQP